MRNIVFITIVGALCGLTGWEEIADSATKRKDHGAEKFNTIRKIALNVLKNDGVDYGTSGSP